MNFKKGLLVSLSILLPFLWVTNASSEDKKEKPKVLLNYFQNCATHKIPFEPQDKIDYKKTEKLKSYYIATSDSNTKRLISVERRSTKSKKFGRQTLDREYKSGSKLYFKKGYDYGEVSMVTELISYSQTQWLNTYYYGIVSMDGLSMKTYKVVKKLQFKDTYVYWPSGKIKQRKFTKSGRTSVTNFTPEGKKIQKGDTSQLKHP
jgi:hypothetical protein